MLLTSSLLGATAIIWFFIAKTLKERKEMEKETIILKAQIDEINKIAQDLNITFSETEED